MPRKTGKCRSGRPQPLDASMRPRPDAAENAREAKWAEIDLTELQ